MRYDLRGIRGVEVMVAAPKGTLSARTPKRAIKPSVSKRPGFTLKARRDLEGGDTLMTGQGLPGRAPLLWGGRCGGLSLDDRRRGGSQECDTGSVDKTVYNRGRLLQCLITPKRVAEKFDFMPITACATATCVHRCLLGSARRSSPAAKQYIGTDGRCELRTLPVSIPRPGHRP